MGRKPKRGGKREGAGRPTEAGIVRNESIRVLVTPREKAALIKLAGGPGRVSALLRRTPRDLARWRAVADVPRHRPDLNTASTARITARLGLPLTATQDEIAAAVETMAAERDVAHHRLGEIAKYANDLDARSGPEDGGSYVHLAVARELQDIISDPHNPNERPDAADAPCPRRSHL